MRRVEYNDLCKITGAYAGSSHLKFLAIRIVESFSTKLIDMHNTVVQRALQSEDPKFKDTPQGTYP